MRQKTPRYSVIVPTYRGSVRLLITLHSLIRQSIHPKLYEIIVVDDGSTDDTPQVIEAFKARIQTHSIVYLRRMNGGPAAARNTGIRNALGSILFFTDDDCEVPALWMETFLKVFEARSDVSGVGGWYRPPFQELESNLYQRFLYLSHLFIIQPYGILETYEGESSPFGPTTIFPSSNSANLAIRRELIEEIGLFDERFTVASSEDVEFCERARRTGHLLYYLPYPVLHHKKLSFWRLMRLAMNRIHGRAVYLNIARERYGTVPSAMTASAARRKFARFYKSLSARHLRVPYEYRIQLLGYLYFTVLYTPWVREFVSRIRAY